MFRSVTTFVYRGILVPAAGIGLVIALVSGCSKPPDRGIFENRTARKALENAADRAGLGEIDEALKFIEEAEHHVGVAMKLTRSQYIYKQSQDIQDDISDLKSKLMAVRAERDADKAREDTAGAGSPDDAYWRRSSEGAPARAGTGTRASTDISDEEEALRTSRLGARRSGADVGGMTEEELLGRKPGEKPAAKTPSTSPGLPEGAVGPGADPVVITRIEQKGKAVVVHIIFNTKRKPAVLGSVTGNLRAADNHVVAPVFMSFLGKGFKPNWKDIYGSEGTGIAGGEETVPSNSFISIVLVGDVREGEKIKYAEVEVTLQDEQRFRGKGPK